MKKSHILSTLLILVMAITLAACNATESSDGPFAGVGSAPDGNEQSIESATIKFIKDMTAGGYDIISTEDLKAKIDANEDMILVDTMPADKFAKFHIPGAINVELPKEGYDAATDEQKQAFLDAIGTDTSKTVVVYCGFVKCARSHVGAKLAVEAGFENVYRQPGGIVAWSAAGYDMESSN